MIAICGLLPTNSRAQMPYAPVVGIVQNVPLGSQRDFAERYLKKSGLEYSYDRATRTFRAILRGTEGNPVRTDIQIVLLLDQNERITEIVIKQIFVGP